MAARFSVCFKIAEKHLKILACCFTTAACLLANEKAFRKAGLTVDGRNDIITNIISNRGDYMYYEVLADELLHIRANLLHVPAHQKLSNMLRGELFVLNYLYDHDAIVHPKELSENLSVSTARIASLLKHMEEKNLIVRTPDAEDSRQIIVRLTPDGEHAIQKSRKDVLDYLARTLESLGPDDAREYIRIQKKIYCNYMEK